MTKPTCTMSKEITDGMTLVNRACMVLDHAGKSNLSKELKHKAINSNREFGELKTLVKEYVNLTMI